MTEVGTRQGTSRLLCRRSCRVVYRAVWALLFAASAHAETAGRINIVLDEATPAYREVADAFVASLGGRFPVQTRLLADMKASEPGVPRSDRTLVVPVGVRAMKESYASFGADAAFLSLLVPRASAHSLSNGNTHASAVYVDQPPARLLALVKLLLPQAKRVGVILSGDTADLARTFNAEAARVKMDLVVELVNGESDIPRALQRLLPRVDVLLLVPDATVVNENTVRHLLLASYRRRIPVIGFSRGLVNAGAVASVVSDPAAIGREGALVARQWNPLTGTLPAARHAGEFGLAFNRQVSRSLGIEVPDDERELARWHEAMNRALGALSP